MLGSTPLEKRAFDNFQPFLKNLVPYSKPDTSSSFQMMQKSPEESKQGSLGRKASSKGKLQVRFGGIYCSYNVPIVYRPNGVELKDKHTVCTPVFL